MLVCAVLEVQLNLYEQNVILVSDQIDQNQFQHSKRGQNSKRVHVRSDVIIISTGRQFNCVTVVVMSHNMTVIQKNETRIIYELHRSQLQ